MSLFFFFSSRRRHTRWTGDWSSDVCSSDLHVDPDRRDRGNDRLDEVRRVETAAEADLDDADVDADLREPLEGEQRRELEVRERDPRALECRAQRRDPADDGRARDRAPADADALGEVD